MTTFLAIKSISQQELCIPQLAVQALQEAFVHAHSTGCDVVYAEHGQLLKKQANGQIIVLKNLADAYVDVATEVKQVLLKRHSKQASSIAIQLASLA